MTQKKILKTPAPKKNLPKNLSIRTKKSPEKIVKTQKIDASGEILGRLATRVANVLRGKDKPDFRPYLVMGDKVLIVNARKIKVTGDKMNQKVYYHHTGYIGHLKSETMAEVFRKDPGEIIKRAVYGMLPKNKLRAVWMKNLEIRNEE